jgi:hypothetical protein
MSFIIIHLVSRAPTTEPPDCLFLMYKPCDSFSFPLSLGLLIESQKSRIRDWLIGDPGSPAICVLTWFSLV